MEFFDDRVSIGVEEIEEFFHDDTAFFGLPRERMSVLLLSQLYIYSHFRIYNIFQITDEIRHLEGCGRGTRSEKETEFKGDVLRGLWKKHFFSERFLVKNILHYWCAKKGQRKLELFIERAFAENNGEYLQESTIGKIANFATLHPYKHRSSRAGKTKNTLTGEWIIFAKHGGKNYYLCIAHHNQGDQSIMRQLLGICNDEFPFLFEVNEKWGQVESAGINRHRVGDEIALHKRSS